MAAVLVHAGPLAPSEVKHKYLKTGDWPAFEAAALACDEVETFLFPPALPEVEPAVVAVGNAASEPDKPGKKNRCGGNRLISVEAAPAEVGEGGNADHP